MLATSDTKSELHSQGFISSSRVCCAVLCFAMWVQGAGSSQGVGAGISGGSSSQSAAIGGCSKLQALLAKLREVEATNTQQVRRDVCLRLTACLRVRVCVVGCGLWAVAALMLAVGSSPLQAAAAWDNPALIVKASMHAPVVASLLFMISPHPTHTSHAHRLLLLASLPLLRRLSSLSCSVSLWACWTLWRGPWLLRASLM